MLVRLGFEFGSRLAAFKTSPSIQISDIAGETTANSRHLLQGACSTCTPNSAAATYSHQDQPIISQVSDSFRFAQIYILYRVQAENKKTWPTRISLSKKSLRNALLYYVVQRAAARCRTTIYIKSYPFLSSLDCIILNCSLLLSFKGNCLASQNVL